MRLATPLALLAVVALLAAATIASEPSQVITDIAWSVTGFCAGFLYASSLYVRRNGRRNGRRPGGGASA